MRTKEITKVFRKYMSEEISIDETLERLKDASQSDLYFAEVELVESDLPISKLADLSEIYPHLMERKSKDYIPNLKDEHPIRGLVAEHDDVNKYLLMLERIGGVTDDSDLFDRDRLKSILDNFRKIEKHFKKEEEAIFRRMGKGEMAGRTILLSQEHDEIMELMDELEEAIKEGKKETIVDKIDRLTYSLRFHAFLENDMLYPVALSEIRDWEETKKECEEIGNVELNA